MKVRLNLICPFCGSDHYVMVKPIDFECWNNGMVVQKAFPYLSATEREQIISGICPSCQDEVFGGEE